MEGIDLAFSTGEMLQAFGVVIPRSPQYENLDASVRLQKQRLDQAGYDIFKKFMSQTVLFRGTHRFKAGDPLARLLEHMRLDGWNPLPGGLETGGAEERVSFRCWGLPPEQRLHHEGRARSSSRASWFLC